MTSKGQSPISDTFRLLSLITILYHMLTSLFSSSSFVVFMSWHLLSPFLIFSPLLDCDIVLFFVYYLLSLNLNFVFIPILLIFLFGALVSAVQLFF